MVLSVLDTHGAPRRGELLFSLLLVSREVKQFAIAPWELSGPLDVLISKLWCGRLHKRQEASNEQHHDEVLTANDRAAGTGSFRIALKQDVLDEFIVDWFLAAVTVLGFVQDFALLRQ